jgi:hypothetical protein
MHKLTDSGEAQGRLASALPGQYFGSPGLVLGMVADDRIGEGADGCQKLGEAFGNAVFEALPAAPCRPFRLCKSWEACECDEHNAEPLIRRSPSAGRYLVRDVERQMRVSSSSSRRHPPIQRSMSAFMRGAHTALRTVSIRRRTGCAQVRADRGCRVSDEEFDPANRLVEVHEQVPELLGDPRMRGVSGGAEDVDAPGGVLDHGHHVGLGAVEQVHREEVRRDDRLCFGSTETPPTSDRYAAAPGRCRAS